VTSAENVQIVRRLWAGLEEDPEMSWLDLCDQAIEIRNPDQFPVRGPYCGHDGARQWATEIWEVIEQLHNEIEEILEAPDGETLVSVQRTQGYMKHTQLRADFRWAAVWTIREGKALRVRGYMSKAEALEAAGLRE
jgi:ketosteroid isomerase-like protein